MNTDTRDAGTATGAERARRSLDRFIFASLLALGFLVAAPYGAVDPWWEGAFEASVFALGALWMLEGMLAGGGWVVPEQRLLLPVIALILFAAAQTLALAPAREVAGVLVGASLSADTQETWRFVIKLAALALALALLLRYTSGARRLRALVHAAAGVGFLSAIFGVLRLVGGRETVAFVSGRLAANRDGFAQFINRNHFAFLAEMALGVALGLLIHAARRRRRLPAYAALALTVWTALVLSNSRGGILSMFVALISTALLYTSPAAKEREASESSSAVRREEDETHGGRDAQRSRRGRRRRGWRARAGRDSWVFKGALLASLLVVTLVGVLWVGGEKLAERIEALPTDVAAEGPRWGDRRAEIWRAAWQLFLDHPLTGVGFGAFRAAVPTHHDASGEMSLEQAHNDYLELLASGGIFGAALFAWLIWMIVGRARRSLRSPDSFRRAAAAGAAAGLLAVAAHSLFDFGLHVTANAYVLVMLIAVVCAGARVEGEPRKQAAAASRVRSRAEEGD
ncbi:MAG TPA: O-antigen ligase family protein [Pyrinomonadaceae bacterium]